MLLISETEVLGLKFRMFVEAMKRLAAQTHAVQPLGTAPKVTSTSRLEMSQVIYSKVFKNAQR